jgi:hypothetical protein
MTGSRCWAWPDEDVIYSLVHYNTKVAHLSMGALVNFGGSLGISAPAQRYRPVVKIVTA